ncbi:MAG: multidrug efflux system membrane fusion protein [Candidatus Azotimanducaceae bacterium]
MSNKNFIALMIGVSMAIWLLSGSFSGDQVNAAENGETAERESLFKVRALESQAREQGTSLDVSGQTEANRVVTVRAEVAGRIDQMPVVKGDVVKTGDVLCHLAIDTRQSDLEQSKAAFKSAELEYKGLQDLHKRGLQSEVNLARAEAALATARTDVNRSELALLKTNIVAPFNGVVEQQLVEEGDYLNVGQSCVTVIEIDPIIVKGQVAERNVNQVVLGREVSVQLITGESLVGEITFVARSPDSITRTFPIEVTVNDPGPSIRAGISARLQVPLGSQMAHLISPAALVLNDAGKMGVRIVEDSGIVRFKIVNVVSESMEGIWVNGLPERVTLITVGHEEVFDGQQVEVDLTPLGAIVSR